jgi:hypothetical protein
VPRTFFIRFFFSLSCFRAVFTFSISPCWKRRGFFYLIKHILFSTFSPRARLIEGDLVDLFKTLEYIV